MAHFDIHDMKKQASLFLREKVKSARLALTDVSRIQLLAEEATNADPWGPETRTMAELSEAALDLEEFERIVKVLHSRLDPNSKRPWRQLFKTLTVLEYLLTHGPASLSNEFKADTDCIEDLCQFNFIDQQGIDRGVGIRNKADRVLELLSKADLWKEERSRAQKISHGIHGFGSSSGRVNVATGNEENRHTKSDVSGPKDAESESLLSVDERSQSNVSPGAEWKPFEKCMTIPSYLQPDDGSSPWSDEGISKPVEHNQWKASPSSPFKRYYSSPSHFRNTSSSIWQAFPGEANSESNCTSHNSEAIEGTRDPIMSPPSNDADGEATPFGDVLQMRFRDVPQLDKVLPPRHASSRRLFGFHKPHGKDRAINEDAMGIEEEVVTEAVQTPPQVVGKMSDLPMLPPPPPSKFRTRMKHHLQA